MTATDFIVAIEIGSTKITGIAGKKNVDGSIQIYAYAREDASSAIRRGVVYNIDKTAMSLTAIINKLEAELALEDASISKAYVGFGGQSLRSKRNFVNRQMEDEVKIQKEIVDSLMEENRNTPYANLEIMEVIPQEYKVKASNVNDPIGMVSNQIEGHYLNIVSLKSNKQNLISAFKQANLNIASLVTAPCALANAILTDNEKRQGCALVDMGAATTTVAIYKNELLRHLVVLPLGSDNITKDICSLQVEESEAKMLKEKYGLAYMDPDDEEIYSRTFPVNNQTIEAKKLNEIVKARIDEIIVNVLNQIKIAGYSNKLPAGIILTGGGSNLKKLVEAFNIRHHINKVRISNFVPFQIKTTHSELLDENGMLNTLFGLLAAGQENCCKLNMPNDNGIGMLNFAPDEDEEREPTPDETERIRKEQEAMHIAQDDNLWRVCQDKGAYEKYLSEYPNGRHASEANEALEEARQKEEAKKEEDFWTECNRTNQWKRYLKAYPQGRFAEEAQKKIKEKPNIFGSFMKKVEQFGDKIMED